MGSAQIVGALGLGYLHRLAYFTDTALPWQKQIENPEPSFV
jgi:hypothetical protein